MNEEVVFYEYWSKDSAGKVTREWYIVEDGRKILFNRLETYYNDIPMCKLRRDKT